MVGELNCPGCDSEFAANHGRLPEVGEVGVCLTCGYLGIMGEKGWCEPTSEQRARLLENEEITGAMTFGMEIAEAAREDLRHLTIQLASWLAWMDRGPGAKLDRGEACALFARWLIEENGYHRHIGE